MKIVIIGGHFTPALAVMEALPKNVQVTYIGRKYLFEKDKTVSLEYQTITKSGIPFVSLTTGRIQRTFTLQTIPSLLKVPYGLFQSFEILRKCKPDIIVGFGGYLSVPVCLAGKILGIPIIIHEQTLEVGLANKIIAHFAKMICISWKSSEAFFPKGKTVLTGNPLPESMLENSQGGYQSSGGLPGITIIGGSSGSHAVNILIEQCLPQLLEKFILFHQTGDAREFDDYERLQTIKHTLPEKLQKRYTIMKYIEPKHFISILKQTDLVISRCGINTITALLFVKKPSLLIPLPISQRNEQYKNAQILQQAGIAEIVQQQTLTGKKLFDKIVEMFNNKKTYEKKAASIKEETDPFSATKKIIAVITAVYQEDAKAKN